MLLPEIKIWWADDCRGSGELSVKCRSGEPMTSSRAKFWDKTAARLAAGRERLLAGGSGSSAWPTSFGQRWLLECFGKPPSPANDPWEGCFPLEQSIIDLLEIFKYKYMRQSVMIDVLRQSVVQEISPA